MHIHSLDRWRHQHDFGFIHQKGEQRTKQVLAITAVTMVVEIIAGSIFGSMALLADGWHMGTHAAAFAITIFAYQYSRKHAANRSFTFGTGKVSVLGGFASAIALAVVALFMGFESVHRFFEPPRIQFNQAIIVAFIGLVVNLVCAVLLQGRHDHGHDHRHHDDHNHAHQHHHDMNLRGAYLHVLADALTSVLAIAALTFGKFFGWYWLDPLMGIVGAVVITRWSYGLLQETSGILLDKNIDKEVIAAIQKKIEVEEDNRVADIHVWKLGPKDYGAILSLVTHYPKDPAHYKALLNDFDQLAHITVEVNQGQGDPCVDVC
ncbi:MAG: CDF family Co(II)/Ni(II) efflux transporter DmeF [Desulfobacteraceae bacterium]|jgi:cation diffusion facilitator family transporter